MSNQSILNELASIRVMASMLAEQATRLEQKLGGTATPSKPRKGGLTAEQKAKARLRLRKNLVKQ